MALRVRDAARALERAISLGAERVENPVGPMELYIPAIRGIGGSLIYLVDRYGPKTIYDVDFAPVDESAEHGNDCGLLEIDHLTHNVHQGRMNEWSTFYERLFGFREQHFFEIEGKQTGLRSRAMVSPCGKIRIPINESADDRSQIVEYLNAYRGEGIQHVAPAIYLRERRAGRAGEVPRDSGDLLRWSRSDFLHARISRLRRLGVLLTESGVRRGLLLQIFTETLIGGSSSR
jgi:4-hydroxyphenylpyruvate dioxygenase